ncbi:class II fructose-bisphosphate aldolase, partial [Escherichia coli]|uniref:class II fructose-bisphosphate aldolase n=1 Tax=Escherichia coli TaxID=562 RepID=UPI003DA3B2C9
MEPCRALTGVELRAGLVGTSHGVYAPGVVPAIELQRLAGSFHCSSVPLALHGGSGTAFDQRQLCTTR